MLSQRYSIAAGNPPLLDRHEWRPYPTITDRASWEALPTAARMNLVAAGEARLGFAWPPLSATLFLNYQRIGDRRLYELEHFERRAALTDLVLAECIENQGRFLDDIVNGIWAICEESFWGVPAHIGHQRAGNTLPDTSEAIVDLFAAETAALLAWTTYLLGETLDPVSPVVRPRIAREIDQRLLTPCWERDDFWWMGFRERYPGHRVNNWNPWICSNWLACILLIETDETRRRASLDKALTALDHFIDPYPRDGGCDEGPSYWGRAGASLFDCLELLYSASAGAIDLYNEPLIQEIGRFIYRVHIDGDYYLNFADAPALVYPDAMLVYRYGLRIGDPHMVSLGAWLAERQGLRSGGSAETTMVKNSTVRRREVPPNLCRRLPALFLLSSLPSGENRLPLVRDVWLPEIEVMVARDQAGSAQGLFVAAKGGHNAESHNHNDVGNFVIYVDGKPVIVDAGVETYTAKTFSDRRYEIWTMQSAYHSLLPTIDGVQQQPGREFKASGVTYAVDEQRAQLQLELATAYPPDAHIQQWQRTITLQRGQEVVIDDHFHLNQPASQITLSIVTPCAVVVESGRVHLQARTILADQQAGEGALEFDANQFTVSIETIPITDERLGNTWGESLARVIFVARQPPQEAHWQWRFLR